MDGTWKDLGETDQDRLDASHQGHLGVALAKQDTQALARDLGREPQPWEVYLAHQQGVGGATALIHADPNANAASVLGGSTDKFTLNGILADATASQTLNITHGYVDRHAQMYRANGVPSAQNLAQNYEQHMQQLAEEAQKDYPGDPTAVERYQRNYAQRVGQQIHTQQMTDQANHRILYTSLTRPAPVKSWQEFMGDPARVDAYQTIFKNDRSVHDKVDKLITTNALKAWDPVATPETDALYKQLDGMSMADRDNFAKMTLDSYYGATPTSQFNELLSTQRKIQESDAAKAEKHVKLTSAITTIKPLLKQAQVTPRFSVLPDGCRFGTSGNPEAVQRFCGCVWKGHRYLAPE